MTDQGIAIAFSGAIGSGKSSVSSEVQRMLGWPRVSFGEYVKKKVKGLGLDETDRAVLQRVGQGLVVSDLNGFVAGVLGQSPSWRRAPGVIVDGLRHAEVRDQLRIAVAPWALKLVIVKVDEDTRLARAQKEKAIELHVLSHYDRDITEAQVTKILPGLADVEIDNSLTPTLAAEEVVRRLGLQMVAQPVE